MQISGKQVEVRGVTQGFDEGVDIPHAGALVELAEAVAARDAPRERKPAELAANRLGIVVSELSAEQKKQLEVDNGLLVEDMVPGIASRAGLRPGDVILSINNQDVTTVEQFNQLLNKIPKGRNIALLVRRGDTTTFITMKVNGEK